MLSAENKQCILNRFIMMLPFHWTAINNISMEDYEEFKSWHEDLMSWERFQDKLERLEEEYQTYASKLSGDERLSFPCDATKQGKDR